MFCFCNIAMIVLMLVLMLVLLESELRNNTFASRFKRIGADTVQETKHSYEASYCFVQSLSSQSLEAIACKVIKRP